MKNKIALVYEYSYAHQRFGLVQNYFYKNKLHRNNLPAVISGYNKYWYRHGLLHRENAPAIILSNGNIFWYENGKIIKKYNYWDGDDSKRIPMDF